MAFNVEAVDEFWKQSSRELEIDITDGHKLTHMYDSFRAFGWIIRIPGLAGILGTVDNFFNFTDTNDTLTLAARRVTGLSYNVETIDVNKVNDRFYYPGRPATQTATISFDNMIKGDTAKLLYAWMRTTYDPIFGTHSNPVIAGDQFKRTMEVVQLDNQRNPKLVAKLYGAFPIKWSIGELSYGTNDFATIDVEVKYDFIVQYKTTDSAFENFLGSLIPGLG